MNCGASGRGGRRGGGGGVCVCGGGGLTSGREGHDHLHREDAIERRRSEETRTPNRVYSKYIIDNQDNQKRPKNAHTARSAASTAETTEPEISDCGDENLLMWQKLS